MDGVPDDGAAQQREVPDPMYVGDPIVGTLGTPFGTPMHVGTVPNLAHSQHRQRLVDALRSRPERVHLRS